MNLFAEIVIFLYLLDNETSKLIIFGSVSGIGVTLWKIKSTSKFEVKYLFYWVFIIILREEKMENFLIIKFHIKKNMKIQLSSMIT